MKKWEYKIVNLHNEKYADLEDDEIQERMNKLGSEGWELVNVLKNNLGYVEKEWVQNLKNFDAVNSFPRAYFKREI